MNRYFIYYVLHFEKCATVDAHSMIEAIQKFQEVHPTVVIKKVTIDV